MRRSRLLTPILVVALLANAVAVLALAAVLLGRSAEAADPAVGAKAYARVVSNGTFDANRSRNVVSVTRPSTGVYCFKLAVGVKNVVASLNAVSAARVVSAGLVVPDSLVSSCPTGSPVVVITRDLAGARVDAPFYVVMH